jgi:hypothetical protein
MGGCDKMGLDDGTNQPVSWGVYKMPNKTDIAKFGLLVLLFIFLGILLSQVNADKNQNLSLGESFRSTTTPTLTFTPTITTTPRSTLTFLYEFEPEIVPTLYQSYLENPNYSTNYISMDGEWYYFWINDQTLLLGEVDDPDHIQELQFQYPDDTSYWPIVISWSPDSTAFLVGYMAYKAGFSGSPYLINLIDGVWQITGQVNILDGRGYFFADWSLDSQYIFFDVLLDHKTSSYIFDREMQLIYEYQNEDFPESITYTQWIEMPFHNNNSRSYYLFNLDTIVISLFKTTVNHTDSMRSYYLFDYQTDQMQYLTQVPSDYYLCGISPDLQYLLFSQEEYQNVHEPYDINIYLVEIKNNNIEELFHYRGYNLLNCSPSSNLDTIGFVINTNDDESQLFIWYWDDFSLHGVGNYGSPYWNDFLNGYIVNSPNTLYGFHYLLQP